MKDFSTLHAQDATFFDEVNTTVQEEPNSAQDAGNSRAVGVPSVSRRESLLRPMPG